MKFKAEPCPWCHEQVGGEPVFKTGCWYTPNSIAVQCPACGAIGPPCGNQEDALMAWNSYAEPPCSQPPLPEDFCTLPQLHHGDHSSTAEPNACTHSRFPVASDGTCLECRGPNKDQGMTAFITWNDILDLAQVNPIVAAVLKHYGDEPTEQNYLHMIAELSHAFTERVYADIEAVQAVPTSVKFDPDGTLLESKYLAAKEAMEKREDAEMAKIWKRNGKP